MTSERMIMLPECLIEEAASLIEQAGLSGTGVSLAAPRLRAALAQPACGEPLYQPKDEAISEIQMAIAASPDCRAHGLSWDEATALYDAGYRKFAPPAAAPVADGEPVGWIIDWPDEPELGHYFGDSPAGADSRSRPLYTAPPAAAHGDEAVHVPTALASRIVAALESSGLNADYRMAGEIRELIAMRAQAGEGGE